jgi:hypothetical protein
MEQTQTVIKFLERKRHKERLGEGKVTVSRRNISTLYHGKLKIATFNGVVVSFRKMDRDQFRVVQYHDLIFSLFSRLIDQGGVKNAGASFDKEKVYSLTALWAEECVGSFDPMTGGIRENTYPFALDASTLKVIFPRSLFEAVAALKWSDASSEKLSHYLRVFKIPELEVDIPADLRTAILCRSMERDLGS